MHADLLPSWTRGRRPGSAVTLLPGNEGIAREVAGRVGKLVDTVAGGGMAGAEEAVAELGTLLDRPTVAALGGIADALAAAGTAGALRRSLAAGLPEELAWPALESVYAQFAEDAGSEEADETLPGVAGVTSTWPVLTVFGRDRAVAVAPDGVRGSCRFTVPDGATMYAVHYVGGSFLVSWSLGSRSYCDTAVWAERPDEPFTPDELSGLVPFGGSLDGAYGFQFETADGGGGTAADVCCARAVRKASTRTSCSSATARGSGPTPCSGGGRGRWPIRSPGSRGARWRCRTSRAVPRAPTRRRSRPRPA
ncbi:hypothetical protein WKI68_01820 [Streptomyces sp. MS1.HAVA.3]|uniref:Uncharacterized protein n=1 Tax=Streptomyces caledonius TaxID=3134107 RepID=A0ABU8TZG9_9ACTN